jgi:hypothetical protein
LSPAKRNKKKTKKQMQQQQEQQNCYVLSFLDMSPFFVFWKDIFTCRLGSPVPYASSSSVFKPEIVAHSCWQHHPLLLVATIGGVIPKWGGGREGSFSDLAASMSALHTSFQHE